MPLPIQNKSFILITLATFLLVNGCSRITGNSDLERAGTDEAVCAKTTDDFYPSHGPIQVRQDLTPYNGLDKAAWALAKLPDGSLVVGGDFTVAGGVEARHVARWNPVTQEWAAIGAGLSQPVHELVSSPGNDLFALAWLLNDSRLPSTFIIYRWTGLIWEKIPQPFTNPLAYGVTVNAMVWDGGSGFFLGGNFTSAAGLAVNGVIHWDGSTWQTLEGALPLQGLFIVQSLAFGQDRILYAGGVLKSSGNALSNRVFAWDGSQWSARGEAFPGPVEALALSREGSLAAVTVVNNKTSSSDPLNWFSIEYDEQTQQWERVTLGYPTIPENFHTDFQRGMLALTGFPAGLTLDAVDAWEGSLFQVHSDPFDLTQESVNYFRLYVLNGRIYALGNFDQLSGSAVHNIAVWEGQTWRSMNGAQDQPVSGVQGEIFAMVIDSKGIVTVGGEFNVAGSSQANNIARWDGKGWQPLGSGLNGQVTSLAIDGQDRVYAGGFFSQAGGIQVPGVARWDPALGRWAALVDTNTHLVRPAPDFSYVQYLKFGLDGRLYVSGFDSGKFGLTAWDGHTWQPFPGLFDKEIMALFVDRQGRLFVGGGFSSVSGKAVHGLVSWDSQAKEWHDLGGSLTSSTNNNAVREILEGPDGSLYVGGDFSSVGKKPVCHIARLLPQPGSAQFEWTQLGNGLPWVTHMAPGPDGSLYAITALPSENSRPDYQAVVLPPGGREWSKVDGFIGQEDPDVSIGALVVDPNGQLFIGGKFTRMGNFPVNSFAIIRLGGE